MISVALCFFTKKVQQINGTKKKELERIRRLIFKKKQKKNKKVKKNEMLFSLEKTERERYEYDQHVEEDLYINVE